ncbi:TonB-dependent receptor domain-containing protein [Roseateles sp. BYS180W]|uniref:TonB-dependent receptor domain-containing protein n=1 Tax=Roseateles rivi TaxID=3299028 RepID=A0ABW7FSL5_9BURK
MTIVSSRRQTRPRSALALISLACLTLGAQAQDQAPETLQRVEVTGSHIKRLDSEGTTPVQVLRREDIARLGASTVQQLLSSLAGSTAALADNNNYYGNTEAPGASAVSLRYFGKQSTLVLLNFRRVAAFPLADFNEIFVNIDALPMDAIERVEILKTGGSALYGSDAVAGVINIITRKDFQGLSLKGNWGQTSSKGRFGDGTLSVGAGVGDLARDGFNVLSNLEYYKRELVQGWRHLLDEVNPQYRQVATGLGALSARSYPGNVNGQAVPGCETIVNKRCMSDPIEGGLIMPSSTRLNWLSTGTLRLNKDVDAFAELSLSRNQTEYLGDALTYSSSWGTWTWGDPSTDLPKSFTYRGLPAGHPLNPSNKEASFQYLFADSQPFHHVDAKQYRALGGLRGTWSGYDFELAAGALGGHAQRSQRQVFSDKGFVEVIGDYNAATLDASFFNKPGGYRIGQLNSPEVLAKLFPTFGYEGQTRQLFVDGRLSGELTQLPAGPLSFAAGFDVRRDSFTMTPTANLRTGELLGSGVSSADAARNFGAAFAELNVPLLKNLNLELAGRADKFQHFDAHFSPKVALRYQPTQQLLLRGTVETGFRAPNLAESADSNKYSWATGISDPRRCPAAQELADALEAQGQTQRADSVRAAECNTGIPKVTRNNPALKPETSLSATFGLVFEPFRGSRVALDWWRIQRKGEIGIKGLGDLLNEEGGLEPGLLLRGSLAQDPTFNAQEQAQYGVKVGHLKRVITQFGNQSRTQTSGLDVLARSEVALPQLGRFTLDLDGMVLLSQRYWNLERKGWGDNLVGRYGYSRLSLGLGAALQSGDWNNALRLSYRGGQSLQGDFYDSLWSVEGCADLKLSADQCQVKAYQRLDYHLAWSGFKNLELGLHVGNVLNRRPPVDFKQFGAYWGVVPQNLEDVMGRTFRISASYRFF